MTIACLSTNATNNFSLAQPVRTLFVATVDGVDKLVRNDDGKWAVQSSSLKGNHIASLVYDDRASRLYAARIPGGVMASDDEGASWQDSSDGVREDSTYSLRCIEQDGKSVLYVGTQPVGLYKSVDGGETWVDLSSIRTAPMCEKWQFPSPEHEPHLKTLTVDPRNSDIIYAGIEQGGLLKSSNGGLLWEDLDEFIDYDHFVYKDIHQVVLRPSNPDEVIITTGLGIYHSLNSGENWAQLTDSSFRIGYPDQILFAPDNDKKMFVAGGFATPNFWVEQKTAKGTVMISDDGGHNWRSPNGGFPESRSNVEAMSVIAFPGGYEIFAGTSDGDIFSSVDAGESWAIIATGLPAICKPTHDTLIAGLGYGAPEETLSAV